MSDEPVRSVLYDVQAAQGAEFEDYDGWIWTLNLGDSLGEYEALRSDVVMWDVYGLVKWDVRGPDAVAAVQRVFTNAIGALEPGQVRYGAIVGPDGALVDDGTVFRHAGDHLWVMTNGTTFADHLAAHASDLDVTVENRLHEMPLISVQGPRSREVLQGLTGLDLAALPYFRFSPEPVEVAGIPAFVLHTGFSGELGFELIPTERELAPALWTALGEAGVRPVGFEAVEIARVEAGLIIHEQDYLPGEQTPYDVGLDRLVKPEADGLLARDALQALAAAPPNRFVTLRLDGDELPELGADVLLDGEVVGCLTSPVESPRHGLIGLARVRTGVAQDGARVAVALADGTVAATVRHDTAHDPEKLRVRS